MFGGCATPNSVYWDACLFIEVLQKTNPARLDACRDLIEKAEKKALVIVTCALTITEVNKFGEEKVSGLSREEQSKFILAFLGNAYIKVRPLDRQTAEFAHHLTRQHSLKNMDAIHAATAVIAKADVLYTYDEKKGKRGGLLQCDRKIGIPPLRIERPPSPSLGPLFDSRQADSPSAEPPEETNESTRS